MHVVGTAAARATSKMTSVSNILGLEREGSSIVMSSKRDIFTGSSSYVSCSTCVATSSSAVSSSTHQKKSEKSVP
jgi:hypothetical protein